MAGIGKKKWTVERGPRVYEVAHFLGLLSKDVLTDLRRHFPRFEGLSSSSRVSMPVALEICMRQRDIKWVCPACYADGHLLVSRTVLDTSIRSDVLIGPGFRPWLFQLVR